MENNLEIFKEAEKNFSVDILDSIAEIQQPRSDFQLEKFVIGQHQTEEMQYYQCVLELQSLYYTIKTVGLEIKKAEIEIARLRKTGDEIDEIDAQIKELGLEQTRTVAIGAFRELQKLIEIYNSFPIKFTRDQIEISQEKYWQKRLVSQAQLEHLGGSQSQANHLKSLSQIGLLSIKDNDILLKTNELENKKE